MRKTSSPLLSSSFSLISNLRSERGQPHGAYPNPRQLWTDSVQNLSEPTHVRVKLQWHDYSYFSSDWSKSQSTQGYSVTAREDQAKLLMVLCPHVLTMTEISAGCQSFWSIKILRSIYCNISNWQTTLSITTYRPPLVDSFAIWVLTAPWQAGE